MAKAPILIALDLPDVRSAFDIASQTHDLVTGFKVGQKLLHHPAASKLIDQLIHMHSEVFLDAKIFDIPETVYQGVSSIASRGIRYTTVYGDKSVAEAAVKAAQGTQLKVLMVTVLTSWNQHNLLDMGITQGVSELVKNRAQMALDTGCAGIICSAQDNPREIKKHVGDSDLLVVTPGIRPIGSDSNDQQRTCTPRQALDAGSDLLVIGRPIWANPEPRLVLEQIVYELHSC